MKLSVSNKPTQYPLEIKFTAALYVSFSWIRHAVANTRNGVFDVVVLVVELPHVLLLGSFEKFGA